MILHIPTKVIRQTDCVVNSKSLFYKTGKKPFVVTYAACKQNGVLDDISSVVADFELCTDAPENPSIEDVTRLGEVIRLTNCDYIIAAGGGSVIDTAKAIAVLATNFIDAKELYNDALENAPLPIIAIPTTCGTGSEVTPVSVLTVGDTKLSFSKECIIPKIAMLDEKYILNLPVQIKRNTAVDALCHCIEGYLMVDDDASDMFSHCAFDIFGNNIDALIKGEFTAKTNEQLLYMGTLGGLAINITRTAAPHAMGYVLTVKEKIPHGLACGLLISSYIKFSYEAKKSKVDNMLKILKFKDLDEFENIIKRILNFNSTFSIKDIEYFTEITHKAATGKTNPKPMTKSDVYNIYMEALNIE